jgi:hypothetical protein
MNKCVGIMLILLLFGARGYGVDTAPKHVFLKNMGCDGQLSADIIASLRQEVRASAGYQLATSLDDSGGYEVVVTVYVVCIETLLAGSREHVASLATIFGTATCTLGSCHVTSNEGSLGAMLCSGKQSQGCGRDLYTTLDQYMSGDGGFIFNSLSKARIKAMKELDEHP